MTNWPSLAQALTIGSAAWAAPAMPKPMPARSAAFSARLKPLSVVLMLSLLLVWPCCQTFVAVLGLLFQNAAAGLLSSQPLAAANEGLKHCRQYDDRGGREQLHGGGDVVELKDVGESAEHDGAGDGADHRARSAEQAGTADDHGGNRGELIAHAVIGAAEVELAGMDDAGQRGGKA